jgi:hypothetical protein
LTLFDCLGDVFTKLVAGAVAGVASASLLNDGSGVEETSEVVNTLVTVESPAIG